MRADPKRTLYACKTPTCLVVTFNGVDCPGCHKQGAVLLQPADRTRPAPGHHSGGRE